MRDYAEIHREREEADLRAATAACSTAAKPRLAIASTWPQRFQPEALHGLAGDIVQTLDPHTEADPAAVLIQFLAGFGNAIGRSAYFRAGADRHYPNLFAVLVGKSSRGRKGSSLSQIMELLKVADEEWATNRVQSGLASGEGLIWAVRDPIEKEEPIRSKDKTITGYQTVVEDPGIADKRLMVTEPEFARVLQVSQRDSNTLSAVIRQAWDSGQLRTMTKSTPAKSTGCHVSIIGHITKDELLKCLTSTEAGNGFANRFLWVCVGRSKLLPEGGALHTVDTAPLMRRICEALRFSQTAGELKRDEEAREMWHDVYGDLTGERMGLFGAVTSRAEAQTLRLSCLYALLDKSATVRVQHLAAALELWRYCEDSAKFIFGESMGDQTADTILQALRGAPQGLSRQEINENVFGRNKRAEDIGRALQFLAENGLASPVMQTATGGRPAERWLATGASSLSSTKGTYAN